MRTLFLAILSVAFVSCAQRHTEKELFKDISSQDLIEVDTFPKLDSVVAIELLSKHAFLFRWSNYVDFLKKYKSSQYIRDSLEFKKEKEIQRFLNYYSLYDFSLTFDHSQVKGFMVRSHTSPDDWTSHGYKIELYATQIAGIEIEPTMISQYYHAILNETGFLVQSHTVVYPNNKIEWRSRSNHCSDVVIIDDIQCDSTITTNIVTMNLDLGKVDVKTDRTTYPYIVKVKS